MAKINGNTIKPRMVLQHNGGLWVVTKASHVKPGGGDAFANVEAKVLESATGN
jgi:elongation factor P